LICVIGCLHRGRLRLHTEEIEKTNTEKNGK
jgi:hypothetical protein